jgi:hypothetical protein
MQNFSIEDFINEFDVSFPKLGRDEILLIDKY